MQGGRAWFFPGVSLVVRVLQVLQEGGAILEQLRRTQRLPLREVFRAELTLSTNIVRGSDFAEGVRALLIDKDKNPQWRHNSAAAVGEDEVGAYFESPWPEHPLRDL